MNKQITILLLLTVVFFLIISSQGSEQKNYILSSDQTFKVSGTSSLHDWEMISAKGEGKAELIVSGDEISGIKALSVSLPSTSLKSGKKGMDDNAYKALKTSSFSQINFVFIEVLSSSNCSVKAKGKLTIAGVSQNITFDLEYEISGNYVRLIGDFHITFTQFKMKPPTAVFGTIKTGNELTVSFNTLFKINKP